jgi:hypothetical protein
MTAHEFEYFWRTSYSKTLPMRHLLRKNYEKEWFRIKSFLNTKNFPSNKKELKALLERQNDIFTDILGQKTKILAVTGEYHFNDELVESDFLNNPVLKDFQFISLQPIDLHEVSKTEFNQNDLYKPYFTEFTWVHSKYNDLLEAIALDQVRMFFVSVQTKCLIAPFDGGIDFIIENQGIKEHYMKKYSDWLAKPFKYEI